MRERQATFGTRGFGIERRPIKKGRTDTKRRYRSSTGGGALQQGKRNKISILTILGRSRQSLTPHTTTSMRYFPNPLVSGAPNDPVTVEEPPHRYRIMSILPFIVVLPRMRPPPMQAKQWRANRSPISKRIQILLLEKHHLPKAAEADR